jgi:hypothetical protein
VGAVFVVPAPCSSRPCDSSFARTRSCVSWREVMAPRLPPGAPWPARWLSTPQWTCIAATRNTWGHVSPALPGVSWQGSACPPRAACAMGRRETTTPEAQGWPRARRASRSSIVQGVSMPTHYSPSRPWRTATQPAQHSRADRARFGVRHGLRAGVRGSVLLEPDPQTDPVFYPTALVSRPVSIGPAAATDPCLGVSRWCRTRYGGARQ